MMLPVLLVNNIIVNNQADLLLLPSNSLKHKESNVFRINSHLFEQNDWFPVSDNNSPSTSQIRQKSLRYRAKLSDPSDEIVAGTSEVVVSLSVSV
mgnify:CR=1 FL=1